MKSKTCIEFSSNKIRITRGKETKKGFTLKHFFTIPLEEECLIESSYDEMVLGDIIKNELKNRRISSKNIVFILSAIPNMLVREIDIPKVSTKNTYEIVKQEASKYFPINLDNYVIDYKLIKIFQDKNVKKQKLICIAIPKFLIEKLIKIADYGELKLEKIDVEINALSKYLNHYQTIKSNISKVPNIICAVQDTYITMIVIKDGVIKMSKTNLYPSVLNKLSLIEENLSTSEEYISEAATSKEFYENNNVLSIKEEIVDNIVKYINFYTSNQREEIETIYITGQIGDKLELCEMLKQRIECNIANMNNLDIVLKTKKYKSDDIKKYKVVLGGLLS